MPANTSPIYSSAGDIQWGSTPLTTANTAYDGSGTAVTVFSASVSGSFVQRLRFKASGSTTATGKGIIPIELDGENATIKGGWIYGSVFWLTDPTNAANPMPKSLTTNHLLLELFLQTTTSNTLNSARPISTMQGAIHEHLSTTPD